MSLQDFWTSVRVGARMIAPSATADSPRINADYVQRKLQSATIWLTPKSVEGFDERDFEFLPEAERMELAAAVEAFRTIARGVSPSRPASNDEIKQALPQFQRVIEILGINRYADAEAFKIGKEVELRVAGRLPDSVLELRFETGVDSSGGEAIWVWVIFEDELGEEALLSSVESVRQLLGDAIRQLGVRRWPYVRFRTNADLDPLAQQEAAR